MADQIACAIWDELIFSFQIKKTSITFHISDKDSRLGKTAREYAYSVKATHAFKMRQEQNIKCLFQQLIIQTRMIPTEVNNQEQIIHKICSFHSLPLYSYQDLINYQNNVNEIWQLNLATTWRWLPTRLALFCNALRWNLNTVNRYRYFWEISQPASSEQKTTDEYEGFGTALFSANKAVQVRSLAPREAGRRLNGNFLSICSVRVSKYFRLQGCQLSVTLTHWKCGINLLNPRP